MSRFLEKRDSIRTHRVGDGGEATCHALSDALDEAITILAADLPTGVAAVAVGGYGRREQSLYSDVDIMLLHDGAPVEESVRSVFYPLWDAGLKVGHSVRTVTECLEAARANLETLTALLSARLLAGNSVAVKALEAALGTYLAGRPLVGRLTDAERERRDTDPYPLMAADLKSGRGGLRTFQGFYWQRRRAELVGSIPSSVTAEERFARNHLLATRNALHAVAGRAVDQFVPEIRDAAARWLGKDLWDAASAVTHSMRVGDGLATDRWPDLMAEPSQQSVATRIRSRIRRSALPGRETRPVAIALRAARRPDGAWLDEIDHERIRQAGAQAWTPEDVVGFVALLDSGARGRTGFDLLGRLGWIGHNLPEAVPTIAAPQLAAFHEHPVDTHLWRTVDEMRHLIDGADDWYASIAAEVDDRNHLLLAAWLHDIGKARDGDHSIVGAEITAGLAERIGLPAGEQLAKVVRLHLLLSTTATKRDTNDLAVIADVAEQCGNLQTLQTLYLLSVADARATGHTMWNDWKATLLRNVFVRLANHMNPEARGLSTGERIAVIAATSGADVAAVRDHLHLLDSSYLSAHTDDEIGAHVGLSLAGRRLDAVLLDADAPAPRLAVLATDVTGLLGAIAGVLTIHNLETLDARLHTRTDGVACDTLHVRRLLPSAGFPDTGLLLRDLEAALAGELDLVAEVAQKAAAYGGTGNAAIVVRAPTDPTLRYTPIEVRCEDQPGALFHIVQALYEFGLVIQAARIDTRGGEVRDLFYVLKDGEPIMDVNILQPIIAGLRSALRASLGSGPRSLNQTDTEH